MFHSINLYTLLKHCIPHKILRKSYLSLSVKETLTIKPFEENILIQGWVQSIRRHKNIYFADIIDGSCLERLQVVIEAGEKSFPDYGSSIRVEGKLVKSKYKGQDVELLCKSWKIVGQCSDDYPFHNRSKYSPEYIRQFLHLRPKTKTFASILRIRSHASQAVHNFFQNQGFHFVHTPILTSNDCEGAGEVFSIKTDKKNIIEKNEVQYSADSQDQTNVEKSFFEPVDESEQVDTLIDGDENEFFGKPVYLTVSGQLHLEIAASALSRVYNFGPIFRAESSRSRQHASEFHMVEAEMAFVDSLDNLTMIVESCIKKIAENLLDKCSNEIHWINEKHSNTYQDYIEKMVSKPFIVMPYTEAIGILQKHQNSLKTEVKLGEDFSSEHKHFLIKHCDNIPLIVTMFPAAAKPFYMKTDSKGMAYCFDVFAPFGGEICGGSLREDSVEELTRKLENLNIHDTLSWYLDLRKYGGTPLGGFGIGFDRLLQSILGIANIRDVIPFPRRKNDCRC